ncbi:hypothetical protein RZO85_13615 [Raoultella ornithinolytica]|uniref:hypothetical protein n=1 Tax=Raoultella ornithinolytica TaxID=54291 RepID=UPI0013C2F5A2|nr:hypothetical protein [Raoultella ornithinolytica]MDV0600743.1 hypothetical protein [Raoultella ornithinolytica]MDV1101749.1 hypothetical protein [Raoultella ornithinolytica]HDT6086166.1 hypothetical protein [Raoultella ornithinolytica]
MMKMTHIIIVVGAFSVGFCDISLADVGIGTMGRIVQSVGNNTITSGVYAAKDTYGMRANAVVLAARANAEDGDSYPVNGFNYTKALSNYGGRDSVGLYADNTSNPFKAWERVGATKYSPTSVSSPVLNAKDIKPGMLLDTGGEPKWSAYVISVQEHKIITNGWVNNKTKSLGIPPDGQELIINPVTKIWATNFNVFLKNGGRANAGVIQENGLINNSNKNPNAINGLDTVVLPGSTYGGTAAYLARSAITGNKQQWQIGFMSQGAKNANFYSADASPDKSTNSGFLENSSASSGLTFSGKNKDSSIEWRSKGKIISRVSPDGQIMKISYRTLVINDSKKLSDDYYRYIVNAKKDVSITLPDTINVSDGFTMEIDNFSNHEINLNGNAKINKNIDSQKRMVVTFASGEWYVM